MAGKRVRIVPGSRSGRVQTVSGVIIYHAEVAINK